MKTLLYFFCFLIVTITSTTPGCQHPVFCNQTILQAVSESSYFADSKTFVDSILTAPIQQVLSNFNKMPIRTYISTYFTTNSTILEETELKDWTPYPSSLQKIKQPELLKYANDLNNRWKQLARKVNLTTNTKCKQKCSTFTPEMNNRVIIIPGGRFQQSYYWDSYWIIKGLIACNLFDTAQILIQNFILMIQNYGFIPNGFRDYFMNRSQPPFLSLMVKDLTQALILQGRKSQADHIEQITFQPLIKQHKFFMQTHSKQYILKNNQTIKLNIYNAETKTPRPQSYKQDISLVSKITDNSQRQRILKGVSSMAESGWDFSSRWLRSPTDLKTVAISDIIPSDLNTLMGLTETYLIPLCIKYQRSDLTQYYKSLLSSRKQYFNEIFTSVSYPDTTPFQKLKEAIYPSDFYPYLLFSETATSIPSIYTNTVNPTSSIYATGEQWDRPNVWAPNNWILHEVTGLKDGFRFAQEWVSTTYCSWKKQGLIYEKYSYQILGKRGQGGQYLVQTGFGWTNGLALYYLTLYGETLKVPNCP